MKGYQIHFDDWLYKIDPRYGAIERISKVPLSEQLAVKDAIEDLESQVDRGLIAGFVVRSYNELSGELSIGISPVVEVREVRLRLVVTGAVS